MYYVQTVSCPEGRPDRRLHARIRIIAEYLTRGITNTGWGERHCSIVNELRRIILRCVNVEGRVTGEGNEAGRDLVAGVDAAYKV